MGQCVGKRSRGSKNKANEKLAPIPPDSPLAELLGRWNEVEECMELEKPRMIYYCMNVWPAD